MHRLRQCLLIGPLVCLSWLGMMVLHECGHALHAWWSAGTVEGVLLHPLAISMTAVHPNPHPHFVVWGGPVWGCVLPLLMLGGIRLLRLPSAYLFRFFAGFCLVANGVYIGPMSFTPAGDPADLLRYGCPQWVMLAFGAVAIGTGFVLWHGQSARFGFGPDGRPIPWRHVLGTCALLAALVVVELLCYWPG
jgi:hypothetical protein